MSLREFTRNNTKALARFAVGEKFELTLKGEVVAIVEPVDPAVVSRAGGPEPAAGI
jgi:hypothetical protein